MVTSSQCQEHLNIEDRPLGKEEALDAGLTDVTVCADTSVMRDFATVLALTDLPELAGRMRDDRHEGAANLVARVERDAHDRRLVLAITLFTVIGRVA